MPEPNPFESPSGSAQSPPASLGRLTNTFAYLAGGIAFVGLLIRYGYPSFTGPFWYYGCAPILSLLSMFFAQMSFRTRTNSRLLKRGMPLLICVVSLLGYAAITVPFAKSPMIYFDLTRHLCVLIVGALLITTITLITNKTLTQFIWLIIAYCCTIFFGTTALGDALSFLLAS